MGIQYPVTPLLITEHQWQISGIETPVIDQQIFEVLEEPFVWYESPIVVEPEKNINCSTTELSVELQVSVTAPSLVLRSGVSSDRCRSTPRTHPVDSEHWRVELIPSGEYSNIGGDKIWYLLED